MIKHVVMSKFKEGTTEAEIADLQKSLGALPGLIPEIKLYEFGRDVVRSPRSCDFALVSAFENLDALRRYQVHPDHVVVLNRFLELSADIFAVDFEQ
jgi:hypothetical protein